MLARKLATVRRAPGRDARRLIEECEHSTYAEQFGGNRETQAEIRRTEDALEGRSAFLKNARGSVGAKSVSSAKPAPLDAVDTGSR